MCIEHCELGRLIFSGGRRPYWDKMIPLARMGADDGFAGAENFLGKRGAGCPVAERASVVPHRWEDVGDVISVLIDNRDR